MRHFCCTARGSPQGWTKLDEHPFDFERCQVSLSTRAAARHLMRFTMIAADDDPGLTVIGYYVFVDPPKASASQAVARREAAGVRIKVISGDAGIVIEPVVQALNLPVGGILTGEEISRLSEMALGAQVEQVDIFARVAPDQKIRIVCALQARGPIVGFLGTEAMTRRLSMLRTQICRSMAPPTLHATLPT